MLCCQEMAGPESQSSNAGAASRGSTEWRKLCLDFASHHNDMIALLYIPVNEQIFHENHKLLCPILLDKTNWFQVRYCLDHIIATLYCNFKLKLHKISLI